MSAPKPPIFALVTGGLGLVLLVLAVVLPYEVIRSCTLPLWFGHGHAAPVSCTTTAIDTLATGDLHAAARVGLVLFSLGLLGWRTATEWRGAHSSRTHYLTRIVLLFIAWLSTLVAQFDLHLFEDVRLRPGAYLYWAAALLLAIVITRPRSRPAPGTRPPGAPLHRAGVPIGRQT